MSQGKVAGEKQPALPLFWAAGGDTEARGLFLGDFASPHSHSSNSMGESSALAGLAQCIECQPVD